MKVLHVSHMYPPSLGGTQIYIKELSEKLVELGTKVTVFTSNVLKSEEYKLSSRKVYLPLEEKVNGVDIKRFPINDRLYKFLFEISFRSSYRLRRAIFKDALDVLQRGRLSFVPKMVWEIIKFKPEIVLALNSYGAPSYFCYLAKRIAKFPLVLVPCLHNNADWVSDPMIYKIMKFADLIIALTSYEKKFIVKKGIDKGKVSLIGAGIDPLKYKKIDGTIFRKKYNLKNEPILTFVGRKIIGKGILTLIEAMVIVWEDIPEARLVLAGADTNDKPFIKKKIDSLDVEKKGKIIQIDDFPEKEKSDIFASCDVFVSPSNIESFGITYLEAWFHKKPVIGIKNTAPSTLIDDGMDGLLVEYGNKEELASAMLKFLNNRKMRIEMGERGRRKVLRNYTWDIIAKKIRKKYYQLVSCEKKNP